MATYTMRCRKCEAEWEVIQSMKETLPTICISCDDGDVYQIIGPSLITWKDGASPTGKRDHVKMVELNGRPRNFKNKNGDYSK